MQLAPDFYELRTKGAHSFLAVEGRSAILIDAGAPGSGPELVAALAELELPPHAIALVVLTHSHIDHAGAAREVRELTGAPIAIHEDDAPGVSQSPQNPFVHDGLARMIEPVMHVLNPDPVEIDVRLADGDRLPFFGGARVVHLPGHTPGSVAVLFESRNMIVTGDALQHRFGELMPPNRVFTRDMDRAIHSLDRLAGFDFEMVVFSHFRPLRAGGTHRVRELTERLSGVSDAAAS